MDALTGSLWLVEFSKNADEDDESSSVVAMGIRDEAKMHELISLLQQDKSISRHPKPVANLDAWEVELPKASRRRLIYSSETVRELLDCNSIERRTCYLTIAHQQVFVSESLDLLTHLLESARGDAPLAEDLDYKALAALAPRRSRFADYRRFSPEDMRSFSKMIGIERIDEAPITFDPDESSDLTAIFRYFPPIAGFAEVIGNDLRMTTYRLRESKTPRPEKEVRDQTRSTRRSKRKSDDSPNISPSFTPVRIKAEWQPVESDDFGKRTRGFCGRIKFEDETGRESTTVNGTLHIVVFDDQGIVEERDKPLHQFIYQTRDMKVVTGKGSIPKGNSVLKTASFPNNVAYKVFVPYTREGNHAAKCGLRLKFVPDSGGAEIRSELTPVEMKATSPQKSDLGHKKGT